MSIGYRLKLRLLDDASIAASVRDRRLLARAVLEKGRDHELLAFRARGRFLDLLAICDRATAGELARRVEIALANLLDLPSRFAPAAIDDNRDQWHLQSRFRLILGRRDPADPLHEASNLPDLLGLRVLGCFTANNVRAGTSHGSPARSWSGMSASRISRVTGSPWTT